MKMRLGHVTNSSSSSFLLAFKDKKEAFAEACEAFLKTCSKWSCDDEDDAEVNDCEDENNTDKETDNEVPNYHVMNTPFHESWCSLDNLVYAMEDNKVTKEKAIACYLESVAWYPVRHSIRDEMYNDYESYPRESADDFNKKYAALIEQRTKERLAEIKKEMEAWLADKDYIAIVEYEDHYPESYVYETCEKIDSKYVKKMD